MAFVDQVTFACPKTDAVAKNDNLFIATIGKNSVVPDDSLDPHFCLNVSGRYYARFVPPEWMTLWYQKKLSLR